MNYQAVADATVPGSAHDALQGITAWTAFGVVTGLLMVAVTTLLLLVRRSDLQVVERAETALNNLVQEISGFRKDLAATREQFVREYATKTEVYHLEARIEKLMEHMTVRGTERRAVVDSEGE